MTIAADRPLLIVEDSPEDFEAMSRTLSKAGVGNHLVHCEDGDDALHFLYRRGPYGAPSSSPRPAIIMLDLNLPGTDGRQVLAQIKQDDDLRAIPVLVFTTSSHQEDIQWCYEAGANSYVKKPVDLVEFQQALLSLKEFWFDTATLP
jgi:CheY-like chemotaxis protein